MKLSRWARVTAIVVAILDLAMQEIALANGALQVQVRPMLLATFILRIPIYGLILWYLLTPEVRVAFARDKTSSKFSAPPSN